MNFLNYIQQPPSKRALKEHFIDGNRDQCPHEMLYCAANLILEMDHPRQILDIGLEYMVNMLDACRADGGFLTPADKRYTPLTVYYNHRYNPPGCDSTSYSNKTRVFQRAWRQQTPVTCDNVYTSELLKDSRKVFSTINSQSILFQRLTLEGQAIGMTCIDFTRDSHSWRAEEVEFVQQFCDRFLGPLSGISEYWRRSNQNHPASKLSDAELRVIRLLAKGNSYKQIADFLGKSIRTVENQIRNSRNRMCATNIPELISKCDYWM